jgi:hypothetical protein
VNEYLHEYNRFCEVHLIHLIPDKIFLIFPVLIILKFKKIKYIFDKYKKKRKE